MRQSEGTGYSHERDEGGVSAADPRARAVSSALLRLAAVGTLEANCKAAVEDLARVLGGSLSLWRVDEGAPVLLAHGRHGGGDGSARDERVLATMKKAAAGLLQGPAANEVEEPHSGSKRRGPAGGLLVSPVMSSGDTWGVLAFHSRGGAAAAAPVLECVRPAFEMAARIEQLNGKVASLRGRISAVERAKDPSERYATIGRLAVHSYRELEETLRAVQGELRKKGGSGRSGGAAQCVSELQRAREIVADQLDLVRLEMPVLKLKDLNVVVQESLREVEDKIHSKGLRLMKRLSPGIPRLLLDEDKVKLAVHKVLGAAAGRSVPEGQLRVETVVLKDEVSLQVIWDEKAPPGEGCQDMFLPFGPLERGGTGMIVAAQIIREHGGGVRIRRYESGSTALILDFPIKANQDRRRRKSRRSGFDRRRSAA